MQIKHKVTIIILLFATFQGVNGQNSDVELLRSINGNPDPFLKNYSLAMSETTSYIALGTPLIMGITGWLKKDDKLLKNSLYVGASLLVDGVLTYGLKETFRRSRPYDTYPDLIFPYRAEGSKSFPSGHTSMAFALATSLTIAYPKWYVAAPSYFWACSVGYSRMNLGVHYPTDVLAGAALGAGSAYLTHVISEWFWKKKKEKKGNLQLAIYSSVLLIK